MVLIGSQVKIPTGKWWEADGVGKSRSNPEDYELDSKLSAQFPYSYFQIGNAIVKVYHYGLGTKVKFSKSLCSVSVKRGRIVPGGWATSRVARRRHFRPVTDGNAGGLGAREAICHFSAPVAARDAQQCDDSTRRRISERKARYADAPRTPHPTVLQCDDIHVQNIRRILKHRILKV